MSFRKIRFKKISFAVLALVFMQVYGQSLEERETIASGNAHFLKKEYSLAQADYAKVLSTNPASLKANYNLGNTYYQVKNYALAEKHFSKAAKASKTTMLKAKALHNLANAQMQQKKYKEAIENYKEALRNNPSDNETRYNLSLAQKLIETKEQNNPKDLPKPSDFAKKQKQKADEMAKKGSFDKAYSIMSAALLKDSSVLHFKTYMDKLNEIISLDSLK